MLIFQQARVEEVDTKGWTPLHYAALNGNLACATALLDAGADPAAVDSKQQNALHIAAYL